MSANERTTQVTPLIQVRTAWRTDLTLIAFLFIFALFLRLYLLKPTPFDGLYGQDAYAYYDFAAELRTDANTGHAPGDFFWPLGYPVLLAASFTLLGQQATSGQIVNILLGAALSPLVYILARQLGIGRIGACAAALMMTFCGQALQSSVVLMSDIPSLFWSLLSAVALWHYLNHFDTQGVSPSPNNRYWLVFASITLAIASITRWLYLILALPWSVIVLLRWKRHIRWRDGILALIGASLMFLPQVLYSRTNPEPTLNHAWVEGWSPHNYFERTFTNIDGHFEYAKVNALYYAQVFYDPYYLAPIFVPFLLLGLWGLFKRGWAQLLFISAWALLPYLFLAGIPYQNIRFPLIVVPAVSILAGTGLQTFIEWTHIVPPKRRRIWERAAVILIPLFVFYGLAQTFTISRTNVKSFITNQQRDKDTAAWAAQRIPDGTNLYTFGLTLTLKHYTSLNVYELYYETLDTLDAKWVPGQTDYLLINVWNIENQWVGRDPQLDFHWLRDQRGLIRMGKFGNYTLYRIRG